MNAYKLALVLGAGGFIGSHLVKRLKREGFWVGGVDLKFSPFAETQADDFVIGDLRDPYICRQIIDRRFDEVYQLAADVGARATFLPATMTPTSCTILRRSISIFLIPATSGT
jgi:nucleoside-diphosphate-sugar epimerase